MSRIIFCTFLKCKAEGQDFQIFSGEIGKRIYNNISKQAWNKWQVKQTKLINENQLDTSNLEHIKLLKKEMINFLFKK